MAARLVSVAVPVPALDLLTYRVPDSLSVPMVGARVVVPLGSRRVTGVVTAHPPDAGPDLVLKDVVSVLDDDAFVPLDVLRLAEWVSDYYLAGPGASLAVALPPKALTPRASGFRTVRVAGLTAAGVDLAAQIGARPDEGARRMRGLVGGRQREALHLLQGVPDGLTLPVLSARGISGGVISRLAELGLVALRSETIERDPFQAHRAALEDLTPAARLLTDEQRAALDALEQQAARGRFEVALVHGVTGSGKTEVYVRLAESTQRRGRGVLVMVPEIALTPAVAGAFRARFGARVAVQHSGLSPGERHDQWHRIRRGDVAVVVGTRSAVFAPLAALGLIIVDEEHDTSYKQDEMPRYHGRDVAVMRGKLAGALVVLGSATPSMESYFNAEQQRYQRIALPRRVFDRPLAAVQIVNMREEYAAEGPEVILSRALREAVAARLDRREQALVLLNRRGYAAAVICRQCGGTLECPNCSVSLTVHTGRRAWWARCHYCNHTRSVPRQCGTCAAPYLEHVGFGTERVESEMARLFPTARVGRVDRDTMRRQGALTSMLSRFANGDLDLLVGTQMIAKGHDFPRVTLVGVISADVGLGMADFRAVERTFQLLTQVVGRAGRGSQSGEAIVQTLVPEHYGIRLAQAQDYVAFYTREIGFRRAMRYPPVVAMVNLVVRASSHESAMDGAATLAAQLRAEASRTSGFVVLGPAPAPLTRLRGEHRAQVFLKGTSRAPMRAALKATLARLPDLARRTVVDVDPLTMT